MMDTNHHIWRVWSSNLHRWGLQSLVASFLEAAGPLAMIGAQVVYVGQPILRDFIPAAQLSALAIMLEDNDQRDAFINCLRKGTQ